MQMCETTNVATFSQVSFCTSGITCWYRGINACTLSTLACRRQCIHINEMNWDDPLQLQPWNSALLAPSERVCVCLIWLPYPSSSQKLNEQLRVHPPTYPSWHTEQRLVRSLCPWEFWILWRTAIPDKDDAAECVSCLHSSHKKKISSCITIVVKTGQNDIFFASYMQRYEQVVFTIYWYLQSIYTRGHLQ